MAFAVDDAFSPRYNNLRWVPWLYRSILPLHVMKRYQCVVVGAERGWLTVAIADQPDMPVQAMLERLTGCDIFPVWVRPARMHLLMRRIERDEHFWGARNRRYYYLPRLQIQAMLLLLDSYRQCEKRCSGRER
jgi:Type II secretion system (T2SS), protein E, N-terminal domain